MISRMDFQVARVGNERQKAVFAPTQPYEPVDILEQQGDQQENGSGIERKHEQSEMFHYRERLAKCFLMVSTIWRVLIPRGQASRHFPHSMHFSSSSAIP